MKRLMLLVMCAFVAGKAFAATPTLYKTLETDGRGYILTDYQPKTGRSRIEYDLRFLYLGLPFGLGIANGTSSSGAINDKEWGGYFNAETRTFTYYTEPGDACANFGEGFCDTSVRHMVSMGQGWVSLDDKTNMIATAADDSTTGGRFALFAANFGGTTFSAKAVVRVAGIRIFEDDTLVRDWVPAKDANGTATLYDLVNGKFETVKAGVFSVDDTVDPTWEAQAANGWTVQPTVPASITAGTLPTISLGTAKYGNGTQTAIYTARDIQNLPAGTYTQIVEVASTVGYRGLREELTFTVTGTVPTAASVAPTAVAPLGGASVATHAAKQKEFIGLPAAQRKRVLAVLYERERAEYAANDGHPQPVRLQWDGGDGACTIHVYRGNETTPVQTHTVVTRWTDGNFFDLDNLEIGQAYRWTVTNAKGEAEGSFVTEDETPRLLNAGVVGNTRDLGGYVGLDGRRVRQGMFLRSRCFDTNKKATYASILTATEEAFFRDFIGLKTEIDLRGENWITQSFVPGVTTRVNTAWPLDYTGSYLTDATKKSAMKAALAPIFDEAKYPIDVHCHSGQDRTGMYCFILEALLGVSEADCIRDWECSALGNSGFNANDVYQLDSFLAKFRSLGGATTQAKAETFMKWLGYSSAQIDAFREIMLEPIEEPDDLVMVTFGDHPHMTAAWTGGDGSVTNAVDGASFPVPEGTTNVRVIFTAESGWEIVGDAIVDLGTVTDDITFGGESEYHVPEVAIADPCLVAFGRGSSNMAVAWTSGDGSVTNAVANKVKAMYVPRGSENVRIICTANPGYELIGESVFDLGTVTDNFTFGQGNDFVFPIAYDIAANVVYLDWDEANGRMTNAVARAGYWRSVEDSEMACAMKGCMVVTNDVTIPIAQVAGATVLVLCNDATLNVTGAVDEAGIEVASDRPLTITVRKGSSGRVVAQGGRNCAGIGSRFQQGAGSVLGAVKIVAGTVTATGGSNAAGIGNGFYGKDGSVKIFGGAVTATGGIGGASDIGDGSNPYSPCEVSVSGGVFAREPQGAWCADHFAVFANDDPASRADYPYAVLPACTLTIGKCPIHVSAAWTSADGSVTNAIEGAACTVPFGKDVRVIFTAEPGWELVGESVVNLGTVTGDITFGVGNDYKVPHAVPAGDVDYLAWDAVNETLTNATVAAGGWTLVTDATRTLNDGWYVVAYDVVLPAESNIVVNGSAHLILCDGASLSVTGGYDQAAIEVLSSGSVTNTLTIYGQTECTGRLTVQCGDRAAGIGSGFYGDFGAVTINGGTVTATGGWGCPAIGNGWWGQGGAVTINAGWVVAAGDMRRGNCAVSIRGGIFGMSVPDAWCAEHHGAFPNPDSATSAEFPYVVLPAWTVTIGDRQHMTVEWTSDDGQMTNVVEGTSFKVRLGERNVRVIFTADSDYVLAGDAVVRVGTVNSDIVFGVGNDFKAPHAGVPYLDWDETNRVMTNAVSPVACDEYSTSIRDLQDGHWYVFRGEHTIDGWSGLRVSGDVHVILCDESSLKVFINRDPEAFLVNEPGIEVGEGSSLTVYGQTNGSGRLTVNGGDGGAAGIGGRSGGPCGVVTINGGVVTATGGSADEIGASGIGTGDGGYGGRVTINGGVVTATGNEYGAGIGDDYRGRNMTVIINGGTVTATGGADGASIKGDNVTIIDGAIDVGNMGGVIAIFGGVFRTQPQVGWLAAARSVVPNMDLTTADTHPWRVVESAKVVSLDAPLGPFATAEEATNAMATAVFVPSEEIVSRILLRGVSPRRYSEKFGFGVTSKGEGAWYVEAALTDAAKAYLAETATKATRQIPVAEIAKYDEETIHGFWVQDCEPGFYYTLYCAAEVCSLPDKGTKCGPAMCFEDGKLMFNWVDKPSEAAGFFTIGVSATKPSSTAATP